MALRDTGKGRRQYKSTEGIFNGRFVEVSLAAGLGFNLKMEQYGSWTTPQQLLEARRRSRRRIASNG